VCSVKVTNWFGACDCICAIPCLRYVHFFLQLRQYIAIYFYWKSLCVLIGVYVRVFLLFVHIFLTLSIYSYFCLCILIVVYVFLLFVHVFLSLSMYTYCCLHILRRGYPDWGFSVLFPQLYGKCQGITSQDGARPALPNCCVVLCIVCFVSFYILFVCKCVLYYRHRVTTQLQLTNISYHIIS
jgi:hypothetical protein